MSHVYSELNLSIKVTDTVQTVFDYCQYLVDLYFVSKYGGEVSIEYYRQYANIDKILDMAYYTDIRRRLLRLVGVFMFIWLTSSISDFGAWYMSYGLITPLYYSIAYLFLLIKILTTIDLTSQVIHVEYRLRLMGDIMEGFYKSCDDLPESIPLTGLISDSILNKNWFYNKCKSEAPELNYPKRSQTLKSLSSNSYHETKWLSRCYLLLTEQCTFINNMYGIRVRTTRCAFKMVTLIRTKRKYLQKTNFYFPDFTKQSKSPYRYGEILKHCCTDCDRNSGKTDIQ